MLPLLLSSPEAVRKTIELFRNHPDGWVRQKAAAALGASTDVGALEALLEGVREIPSNPSPDYQAAEVGVQSAIMTAIAGNSAPGTYDALTRGARAANEDVRRSAATALGDSPDPRAGDTLAGMYRRDSLTSVRCAALVALGRRRDPSARTLQVDALRPMQPEALRVAAVESVTASVAPDAGPILIRALEGDDALSVRLAALKALRLLQGVSIDESMAKSVPADDLKVKEVVVALSDHGWHPRSEQQRVYWWITLRDVQNLNGQWEMTKQVLLRDVVDGPKERAAYALETFIGLGRDEIIQPLIDALSQHGTKPLAEAYLNCGHDGLAKAAGDWAARNGYSVVKSPGSGRVRWGSMGR